MCVSVCDVCVCVFIWFDASIPHIPYIHCLDVYMFKDDDDTDNGLKHLYGVQT